jgi:hypothetical protein
MMGMMLEAKRAKRAKRSKKLFLFFLLLFALFASPLLLSEVGSNSRP